MKKTKFEDDGRTIANMNIEGMPWYTGSKEPKNSAPVKGSGAGQESAPLSPGETWAITKGVLLASLAVGAVFVVVFTLFILFCVFVWMR